MHLLIDADSLCYAAGFVANEPGQENLACYQAGESIKRQLQDTQCNTYQLYLSGSNNFRYAIYPEYKGNRVDMKRPIHLQAIREYLVGEWGATVTDGIEADDAVSIAQCIHQEVLDGNPFETDETCISHIDKDIDNTPGRHWNPTKKQFYTVSNEEAMRHFFWQIMMGDKVDNVPGWDGKMRQKTPKFMEPMMASMYEMPEPEGMLEYILSVHHADPVDIARYMHCLWIQRKEDDEWINYLNDNTMEELGLKDAGVLLSRQHLEQLVGVGHPSSNA